MRDKFGRRASAADGTRGEHDEEKKNRAALMNEEVRASLERDNQQSKKPQIGNNATRDHHTHQPQTMGDGSVSPPNACHFVGGSLSLFFFGQCHRKNVPVLQVHALTHKRRP